jgi:hypothetical protein
MLTKAIFHLYFNGLFAAHDVVRKKYGFFESEPTVLKPLTVRDGRRQIAPGPSNSPLTPPMDAVINIVTF